MNLSYQIVRVDPEAKAMDILYTSPEHGSLLVGARMPWEGETVEAIAEVFSPARYWLEKTLPVAQVSEGEAGELSATVVSDGSAPRLASKLDLVRAMRITEHADGLLWDAFKAQITLADEASQEDWQLSAVIAEDDPVYTAVLTTIYGDEAAARIAALFGAEA
jgi:hypothetical protein